MSTWEDNIRKVVPYTPGEQPNDPTVIKLNTNENPYPPSPKVNEAFSDYDDLRKYPDSAVSELVNAIANYHNLSSKEVFVGVGSDDVIAMAFMTFFNSKKPILFPDISYSFYDVWAKLFGIPYKEIPLDENFRIQKDDFDVDCGGIIFPNPNAPTGILEPLEFIEAVLIKHPDVVVIIDEAYIDFGGVSALRLLPKYENLLVIRTFSKSRSMAGQRIGYAMGNEKLIKFLNDVKYSYNSYTMNMQSIKTGVASIMDEEYFRANIEKIITTREWFKSKIEEMGFKVLPSSANFVFATHESINAANIFGQLKKDKIYVRYFNKPRIDNYLRITIGTRNEMETLLEKLRKITNL